jgi:hypothetical protein
MNPETYPLSLQHQYQQTLADRTKKDVELAELQHQMRLLTPTVPPTMMPPAVPSQGSNRALVSLIVILCILVVCLVGALESHGVGY